MPISDTTTEQQMDSQSNLSALLSEKNGQIVSKPHNLAQQAAEHPELLDEPAYLFWKIQSQLTKLNNRLHKITEAEHAEHRSNK